MSSVIERRHEHEDERSRLLALAAGSPQRTRQLEHHACEPAKPGERLRGVALHFDVSAADQCGHHALRLSLGRVGVVAVAAPLADRFVFAMAGGLGATSLC